MTTQEIVTLLMHSCDTNPYSGKLSKRDTIIGAIDLAKLCKNFAEKGYTDEAMHVPTEQWNEVIEQLHNLDGELLRKKRTHKLKKLL